MTSAERVAVAVPVWDDELQASEPLIRSDDVGQAGDGRDEGEEDRSLLSKLQFCSLAFGVFVGFFVESGALAAHVLYQGIQWNDTHPTATQLVSFSLAWATATALLPCFALLFLRTILLLVTDRVSLGEDTVESTPTRLTHVKYQNRLQDCLWHLESRFGLGSFFGVSLSATFMDLWMGVHRHLLLTAMLLFTVTLCFLLLSQSRKETNVYDEAGKANGEEEVELGSSNQHVVVDATAYPKLNKKMDSVDPTATSAVELKEGSLLIV